MKKLPLLVAGVAAAAIGAAGVGTAFASAPSLSRVPAVHVLAPTSAMDSTSATEAPESAGNEKASSESTTASDGPGGYADSATGNANTQQEGEH